jgi:hypothetical protein
MAQNSIGRPFFDNERGKGTWYEWAQEPHNRDLADYCGRLWQRFQPYCSDVNFFLDQAGHDFEGRTWEIRVACAAMDAGHKLAVGLDPPDVLVDSPIRVALEAMAAQPGTRAHPARRIFSMRKKVPHGEIGTYTISRDNMLMRITGALDTKAKKHADYIRRKRVLPTDPYVVAISAGMMNDAVDEIDGLPLGVRAVYGDVDLEMHVPVDGDGPPDMHWRARPTITRTSGETVSTRVFLDGSMPHVSAMLYTAIGTHNAPRAGKDWRDLILIHNPTATIPLPRGWLPFGREYWIEDDRICCEDRRPPPDESDDDVDPEIKTLVEEAIARRDEKAGRTLEPDHD